MKTSDYFTMNTARTKAAKAAYENYKAGRYDGHSLWDAYDRPSRAKEEAFDYCRRLCYDTLGGHGLVLLSHNCMQFSVGFEFEDPETGVCRFAYITRDYNSTCEI